MLELLDILTELVEEDVSEEQITRIKKLIIDNRNLVERVDKMRIHLLKTREDLLTLNDFLLANEIQANNVDSAINSINLALEVE